MATGLQPVPTCERDWDSNGGHRRDFMVGCPLAAAALSCRVQPDRWIAPHLAVQDSFSTAAGRLVGKLSLCNAPPFCLPLGCLLSITIGVPSRLMFKGFGRFMMNACLSRMLCVWMSLLMLVMFPVLGFVWSGAAETALAGAYRFCGGPIPSRGLVLGRGGALFRVVKLGGHQGS